MRDLIVGAIVGVLVENTVKMVLKKIKCFLQKRKEKKRSQQIQKQQEIYQEMELDEEWEYLNNKIDKLLKDFRSFSSNWGFHKPDSKKRIQFLQDYLKLLEEPLEAEQENTLYDIKKPVIELYSSLLETSEASKKEKKEYSKLLERIEEICR